MTAERTRAGDYSKRVLENLKEFENKEVGLMYDWAWITNDIGMGARLSMISDFLVFASLFLLAWLAAFWVVLKLYGPARAEAFARARGFRDYADLRGSFTSMLFSSIMIFFALMCLIFFFTHLAEVRNDYRCASIIEGSKACEEKGPTYAIVCENVGFKLNSTFPLVRGPALNQSGGINKA